MTKRASWPFGDLRPLSYGVILADPPWRYFNWSEAGEDKNAVSQYVCMNEDAIAALPVADLAGGNCLLWMWTIAPMLPNGVAMMNRWGFRFVTAGAWAKQSSTGRKWAFGTGYVMRGAAEFFLIGALGNPHYGSKSERNLIVAPTRGHSRKPDDVYGVLERLCPRAFRVELFARQRRPGWDAWGNETNKFTSTGEDHAARPD